MNRAERRRMERLRNKEIKNIKQGLIKAQDKTLNDGRAEAMLLLFALTLHEEFGFGQQRCLKALQRIDNEMALWVNGTESLETLRKKVFEEIGIEVKM